MSIDDPVPGCDAKYRDLSNCGEKSTCLFSAVVSIGESRGPRITVHHRLTAHLSLSMHKLFPAAVQECDMVKQIPLKNLRVPHSTEFFPTRANSKSWKRCSFAKCKPGCHHCRASPRGQLRCPSGSLPSCNIPQSFSPSPLSPFAIRHQTSPPLHLNSGWPS